MTALAQLQDAMLACILDDDRPLPAGWGARQASGLDIYRNNYRAALVEALRSTYERTERLVGAEAFRQAAAHHCISHPPSSWTLDLAGESFAETCRDLFAKDDDVAELAELEWAMHCVFTAPDHIPISSAAFSEASAGFADADWANMQLRFVPRLAILPARYDLVALWQSLALDDNAAELTALDAPHCAIVWREGERPVFVLRPVWEGDALAAMIAGGSYGEACGMVIDRLGEEHGIAEAGAMLARWLTDGLITAVA